VQLKDAASRAAEQEKTEKVIPFHPHFADRRFN
jgi:hypothetical protein